MKKKKKEKRKKKKEDSKEKGQCKTLVLGKTGFQKGLEGGVVVIGSIYGSASAVWGFL